MLGNYIIFHIFGANYGFDYRECSREVRQAMRQLSDLHKGDVDLTTTFGKHSPSLPELRAMFYESVLEILHEQYPDMDKIEHAPIDFVHELEGMARIRKLFVQYITKTSSIGLSGSFWLMKLLKKNLS